MKKIPITIKIEIIVDDDPDQDIQTIYTRAGVVDVSDIYTSLFIPHAPRQAFPTYPTYTRLARLNGSRPLSLTQFSAARETYFNAIERGDKHIVADFREILFLDEWEKSLEDKGEDHGNDPG